MKAEDMLYSQLLIRVPWNSIKPGWLPFYNGLLQLEENMLMSHSAGDYLMTIVPWPFVLSRQCPVWEQALQSWFGEDPDGQEKILALQEFFGYCLMMHSQYKTALLMLGPPNSGKSTIERVLSHIMGPFNTCSLPLDKLDDPRVLAQTQGKLLVVADELDHNANISEVGFRRLVSNGQPITIKENYRAPKIILPMAKLALFSHCAPKMSNWSEATLNRFLLIELTRSLSEAEQEKDLLKRLFEEILGIVAWSVQGAKRLLDNTGRFTRPASSSLHLRQLRQDQNPLLQFLADCCEPDPEGTIPTKMLTEQMNQLDPDKQYNQGKLSRQLKSMGYTVTLKWHAEAVRCRCLVGYRLINEVA